MRKADFMKTTPVKSPHTAGWKLETGNWNLAQIYAVNDIALQY